MTESILSQSASWAALNRCLHHHQPVIGSDLRLQAAHAAFQLQLATLHALHPNIPGIAPGESLVRASLEFVLREISSNLLIPAAAPTSLVAALPQRNGLEPRELLELAEETVRFLRDNPSLWSQFGLAALQVRALADLQDAYALEAGMLAPAGDLEDRTRAALAEIGRLIRPELDTLVRAHETSSPAFVTAYREARQSQTEEESAGSRSRIFSRFGKKTELTLSN